MTFFTAEATSSPANKPGSCPSSQGGFGICVESCSSDSDCDGDNKCCSNGCGHTCQAPVGMYMYYNGLTSDCSLPRLSCLLSLL